MRTTAIAILSALIIVALWFLVMPMKVEQGYQRGIEQGMRDNAFKQKNDSLRAAMVVAINEGQVLRDSALYWHTFADSIQSAPYVFPNVPHSVSANERRRRILSNTAKPLR